ncbi:MAG: hypothetical protein R3C99_21045 [Pirellulaceae bacterium]
MAKLVLYDSVDCPVDLTFTVVDSIGILWPEDSTTPAAADPS